ncbi:MAG: hypothetical protein HeimC2_16570 [Candidatus Heimdallarchaeota archaeon LC_2]|nr:MAG: hypothetical protein HeimC2_16570 [Candidatus Heimdallarchaeota archaeon LC_2]
MYSKEVRNAELLKNIQLSFLEAMGIFVFTIFIGILNAVNLVDFTRAELLFHLHSGTIGWLSLSAVTLLVWYFTGERDLTDESLNMANSVLKFARIIIPIYVAIFYLGFTLAEGDEILRIISIGSGGNGYFILLVTGALLAIAVFGFTFYFGLTELGKIEMKTTPHYLFLGAMLTSTYGGIFGLILEIQNLIGESFFDVDAGQDGVAAHAAAMEAGYLFMFITAVLEWQIIGDKMEKISMGGYVQTGTLFFAGLTVAIGAGFNLEPLLMLNLPLLIIGFILIVIRVFTKIKTMSIIETSPDRFFIPAAIALTFSIGFFIYFVSIIIGGRDPTELFESPWIIGLFLSNIHTLFVGGATGVILASILVLVKDVDEENKKLENVGFGLMYIGLLGFVLTLLYRGDLQENGNGDEEVNTHIAAIMGIGLYLILYALFTRLRKILNAN